MTKMGQAVLDGDEIVIRVPVSAVIERAVQKYDLDVNDNAVFAAEIVEDLNKDLAGILGDLAGSMVEEYGSVSALSHQETNFNAMGHPDEAAIEASRADEDVYYPDVKPL